MDMKERMDQLEKKMAALEKQIQEQPEKTKKIIAEYLEKQFVTLTPVVSLKSK